MIKKPTAANISKAAALLRDGKLVAFPTETVYGLGANALDSKAVWKIFSAKKRPLFDPLIVHVSDIGMLKEMGVVLDKRAERLASRFWPGPLTLIVKRPECVPRLVTSGLETMAIRIPDHPVALKLIRAAGVPVAAPSANPFGYLSPVTALHVEEQLGKRIPMILDGGSCRVGLESTILDITRNPPVILRPGGITVDDISKYEGPIRHQKGKGKPSAPGQLKSHYAPLKPLVLLRRHAFLKKMKEAIKKFQAAAFLAICPVPLKKPAQISFLSLSKKGDLKEASKNLFHHLHALDRTEATIVYAEKPSSRGMGLALVDRLTRASQKRNRRQHRG